MSPSDDDGYAISYKVLERGTPVRASDGVDVGTVRDVLESKAEHIFDGLVIDTPDGQRFVDAPEVVRIAERRVSLSIDADAVAALPEKDSAGGKTYRANPPGRGRLGRFLGGGWKRD